MYEPLTEKEISYMECWYDPVAMAECLMPENLKAPQKWSEDSDFKCVRVRNYQFPMLDYSSMYADDSRLTQPKNFRIKKVVGTLYNIAARDVGKSYFIWIDAFCTLVRARWGESMLAAPNNEKLKKIADPLLNLCREHPFFNIFKKSGKVEGIKSSPSVEIATQPGHTLYGRNENIDDEKKTGDAFHSVHAWKKWYEEYSYATKKGQEKGIDSEFSLGCIERYSGIPDLRPGSPLGDTLRNKEKRTFICRLPQYFRGDWNEHTRNAKAQKYKGKHSTSYKLNVEGEILEGAFSKWDMQRIRQNCLQTDKLIKYFELNKDIFADIEEFHGEEKLKEIDERLSNNLIIIRVPSIRRIIASDIGTTGSPSEVAIYFGDDKGNWKYEYQISLHKMTTKEQAYVFDWLYRTLNSAFIVLDHSNEDGRSIAERLVKEYKIPNELVMNFWMQKNLDVGFVKDENGKVVLDDNRKPMTREVYTKTWAVQQLEEIFYESKIEVPMDEKFLDQFANHFEKNTTGSRPSWGSSTDEHLVDTFLLFALCSWFIANKTNKNTNRKKRTLGYI